MEWEENCTTYRSVRSVRLARNSGSFPVNLLSDAHLQDEKHMFDESEDNFSPFFQG